MFKPIRTSRRAMIRLSVAALLVAAGGHAVAAEVNLVCSKTSGIGGRTEYVVVIDTDKKEMTVDGSPFEEVKVIGNKFLGSRHSSRHDEVFDVDRVTMAFSHISFPTQGRTVLAKLEGRCEKRSAGF